MATINYYIQSKSEIAGIYVRLRDGNIDAKAKTKYAININDWSAKKGQPKNLKHEAFKKLNNDLVMFKANLLAHYNSSVHTKTINSQWLKDIIHPPEIIDGAPNKLVQYFDYYAIHRKNLVKGSTQKKLKTNKHLLEKFQKETNKEYLIRDVDSSFRLAFEAFCIRNNYAPNTIARSLKYVKTICFHARKNRIETHYQLDNIQLKYERGKIIYLNNDELKLIENAKIEADYLINARDWLIISCETGQRISDFLRFDKKQVIFDDGIPYIKFTQVKTEKERTLVLSPKVMTVLEKRGGNFPRKISHQRYNDYLKEIGQKAGLTNKIEGSLKDPETNRRRTGIFEKWELIASHIGRRSFATNNYGKIPTPMLMYATGHSTEAQFLEYIGKTDTEKSKELATYFYNQNKESWKQKELQPIN
jgi:integrase